MSFRIEELLVKFVMLYALQTLLALHSTLYIVGRTVVPLEIHFLLLVWITFRDGNLCSFPSRYENLMLLLSDGSFLSSVRSPFVALWIVPLAGGFLLFSSGCSRMFRVARAFIK